MAWTPIVPAAEAEPTPLPAMLAARAGLRRAHRAAR